MLLGLVRLFHVNQLLLKTAVLPQELLQLRRVVLEAVRVRRAATFPAGTRTVTPGGRGEETARELHRIT